MAGNAPREAPDCTPRVPRVRTSTATCGLATFRLTQSAVTCARNTRQTGCYCEIVNARATLRRQAHAGPATNGNPSRTYSGAPGARLLPPCSNQIRTYVHTFVYICSALVRTLLRDCECARSVTSSTPRLAVDRRYVRTYVARHSGRHASALKILCVRRSFSFSLSSHDPGEVDDDRFAVYDTVLLEHPFELRLDTVR